MENISQKELQDAYWKHLLLHGVRPKNVFAFMNSLDLEESNFYEYFTSLEAVESHYWQSTVDETIEVLHKDEDYIEYPADQKLLAFYFTYITHIQKVRSRLVHYFPQIHKQLNSDRSSKLSISSMLEKMSHAKWDSENIKGMKHSFKKFASDIVSEGIQHGMIADRKQISEQYDKLLFIHFLAVIHFYIRDTSKDFQDTDAFIEKSTHFAFQVAGSGVLESGFDFLRFIAGKDDRWKEISKMISKCIPEG